MPLNTQHTAQDEAPLLDGDDRFLRVVLRGNPALLAPGMVNGGINLRLRDGVPEPRGGCVKLPWLNQISGTTVRAWDSVQGKGSFVDAAQRSWTLLAVNGGIRACLPHNAPRTVALPAGETLPARVTFEQFRGHVYLFRGADLDPLRMADLAVGFEVIPDPIAAGVSRIPRGPRAVNAGDRLWVMTGTDQVWASDLLDPTSYSTAAKFRFSDGTADSLVTIAVHNEATTDGIRQILVGLKGKSVWRLNDIVGDLSTTKARAVTHRYGCLAADSVVDLGGNIGWWCQEGFTTFADTQVGEARLQAGDRNWPAALTDEILPLVKRVRGDYAGGIAAELVDGRLYIGVPLDAAETLSYELVSGAYLTFPNTITIAVTTGATYRYTPGANEVSLENGAATYTVVTDFVAAGSTVTLNGSGPVATTASLKRVYKGINNAVLVYDFKALEAGWQGYDQADGILFPKYWFRRDYNGTERLFFIAGDGWVNLYEEGPEDALSAPYVDVRETGTVVEADSIQVNGGTFVEASAPDVTVNSGTQWGAASAADNLFVDVNFTPGYAAGYGAGWGAPNTHVLRIPGGVRFYSTNGSVPIVDTNSAGLTVSPYLWQPIVPEFLSRGYTTPVKLERKTALKLQVLVETWGPTYSIALKSEGVNQETEFVSDQTRSRTRYDRPFHKQAWLASNVNNDFPTPDRQDYSLHLSTPFLLGAGLGLELHQAAEHSVAVNGRSRAHQVRITNLTGRLRITGIGYESRRRERGLGIKV